MDTTEIKNKNPTILSKCFVSRFLEQTGKYWSKRKEETKKIRMSNTFYYRKMRCGRFLTEAIAEIGEYLPTTGEGGKKGDKKKWNI